MARKLQNKNEPKLAAVKASETINRDYTERRLVSVGQRMWVLECKGF